jgi:hypothetical protein
MLFFNVFSPARARARNEFVLIYSASERLIIDRKKSFFSIDCPRGAKYSFFLKTIYAPFQQNLKTEF